MILFQQRGISSPFVRLNGSLMINVKGIQMRQCQKICQIVEPFAKHNNDRQALVLWLLKCHPRFCCCLLIYHKNNIWLYIPAIFGLGHKDWNLSKHTVGKRQGYTPARSPVCYRAMITHSQSHLCAILSFQPSKPTCGVNSVEKPSQTFKPHTASQWTWTLAGVSTLFWLVSYF